MARAAQRVFEWYVALTSEVACDCETEDSVEEN